MAERGTVVVVEGKTTASIAQSDHKHKHHEDIKTEAPEPNDSGVSETEYSNAQSENEDQGAADVSDEPEAKRPCLELKPEEGAVSHNGCKAREAEEANKPTVGIDQIEKNAGDEITKSSDEIHQVEDVSYAGQQPTTDKECISRKMDVPNNKADAGGSPSLVARGFATAPAATGVVDLVQTQVPNEKVSLIIGRLGETIKSLQTRSGAHIQVGHIPIEQSKFRNVKRLMMSVHGDPVMDFIPLFAHLHSFPLLEKLQLAMEFNVSSFEGTNIVVNEHLKEVHIIGFYY